MHTHLEQSQVVCRRLDNQQSLYHASELKKRKGKEEAETQKQSGTGVRESVCVCATNNACARACACAYVVSVTGACVSVCARKAGNCAPILSEPGPLSQHAHTMISEETHKNQTQTTHYTQARRAFITGVRTAPNRDNKPDS